jgi:2-oxoglutarate ferredoxin oxidoreductase subunit gamma
MCQEIICSGFGGQGVLTTGILIASAGHEKDLNVTWYPSYGAEMRGGTANCNVKISKNYIASPYCKNVDILITMNEPAIDRFEPKVKNGGYLFVNSSLVSEGKKYRDNINVIRVKATELAERIGNSKGANIVMLGAVVKQSKIFENSFFIDVMCRYFENQGKGRFNTKNVEAFETGYDAL